MTTERHEKLGNVAAANAGVIYSRRQRAQELHGMGIPARNGALWRALGVVLPGVIDALACDERTTSYIKQLQRCVWPGDGY